MATTFRGLPTPQLLMACAFTAVNLPLKPITLHSQTMVGNKQLNKEILQASIAAVTHGVSKKEQDWAIGFSQSLVRGLELPAVHSWIL